MASKAAHSRQCPGPAERGSKDYKVESTPTLFGNGKMLKGGATIEKLEKLMARS